MVGCSEAQVLGDLARSIRLLGNRSLSAKRLNENWVRPVMVWSGMRIRNYIVCLSNKNERDTVGCDGSAGIFPVLVWKS
jgi:hypothetical protein